MHTIHSDGQRVAEIVLDSGETLRCKAVMSSAGYPETLRLLDQPPDIDPPPPGELSFVESISILDCSPAELGIDETIIFFNDSDRFHYAVPHTAIDARSGVICCPNNYAEHDDLEGTLRITSLANYGAWVGMEQEDYVAAKSQCYDLAAAAVVQHVPDFRPHVTYRDIFTPRTVEKFTGHINGAVYGAPTKVRDGRTHLDNLFICGTDQGYLGIIGACLSGISMANLHVLSES